MILAQHALSTSAKPDAVWECCRHVSRWPGWDASLSGAVLQGPFVTGARGFLVRRGRRRHRFSLAEVTVGTHFSYRQRWFLAELVCTYTVSADPLGTRITSEVKMDGPLARLYALLLRRRWKRHIPAATRALARLAAHPEDPA